MKSSIADFMFVDCSHHDPDLLCQKDSPSTDPMPMNLKRNRLAPQTQSDVIIRLGMQFQEDSVMAVYRSQREV